MDRGTILERQTDFTREELIAFVKDGGGEYPFYLCINELVILFWQGDAEAGKFLCSFLPNLQIGTKEQYRVYTGLSSVPKPGKKVLRALEEFRSNPKNQQVVKATERDIQNVKEVLTKILLHPGNTPSRGEENISRRRRRTPHR